MKCCNVEHGVCLFWDKNYQRSEALLCCGGLTTGQSWPKLKEKLSLLLYFMLFDSMWILFICWTPFHLKKGRCTGGVDKFYWLLVIPSIWVTTLNQSQWSGRFFPPDAKLSNCHWSFIARYDGRICLTGLHRSYWFTMKQQWNRQI